jgi:signal transduction histidine kinase
MMEGKDLNAIIQSRIEIFEKNNDIQFNINIPSIYIEPKLMLKFYRIIAELINNSIKHAQCNKINIQFLQTENGYTIDYTDNGIGFNQNLTRNHGLNNIESRVKFLHGNIDFYSTPGKTHYSIHFPFQPHEK